MKKFEDIAWHDVPYEDPCDTCSENINGYVWTEDPEVLYALPCGHGQNSRRKLTSAEIAFVMLMEPKT